MADRVAYLVVLSPKGTWEPKEGAGTLIGASGASVDFTHGEERRVLRTYVVQDALESALAADPDVLATVAIDPSRMPHNPTNI